MLGGIVGDVVGSRFEGRGRRIKHKAFELFHPACRFTDDTVCTCAVADWLLRGGDLAVIMRDWVRRHPRRGYGGLFRRWASDPRMGAYGSWGNGAAMRVGPVGWAAGSEAELLDLAERSAVITHDHPEAVRAACAVALSIWLARRSESAAAIRGQITRRFGYDLDFTIDAIRPHYRFDVSAAGTVPPALVCALDAVDFEDALRNAVSLGGDSDTLACIAGAVAEPLFGIPAAVAAATNAYLTPDIVDLVGRFEARFGNRLLPPTTGSTSG